MSILFAAARRAVLAVAVGASFNVWALQDAAVGPVQDVLAARQAAITAAAANAGSGRQAMLSATASGNPGAANDIVANPFRAYAPSCLSDGLPFRAFPQSAGDPAPLQATLNLPGDPAACLAPSTAGECATNYVEAVTVTAWRVACSANTSAVLVEFDRSAANDNNVNRYPTFPAIAITQNGQTLYPVRLADDPNTLFSITRVNAPLYSSDIFVLENYLNPGEQQIDYNKAFTLTFDNTLQFTFPDYDASHYVAASQSLPISGYMTSNWFDPLHGGEGILTQVFENADGTRTFTAAWYTFDKLGIPYWLFAQGTFQIGARSTGNVDTFYGSNGGFAGINYTSATFTKWGTINFSFPDCDHMTFTFSGSGPDQNAPSGTGTRTWLRIANVNSLTCKYR